MESKERGSLHHESSRSPQRRNHSTTQKRKRRPAYRQVKSTKVKIKELGEMGKALKRGENA